MSSTASRVRPPQAAAWLVELFTSAHEADGVLGDLAEDFSGDLADHGIREARRRYWRQALCSIKDLAVSPLAAGAPLSRATIASRVIFTAAVGVAGLALTWPIGRASNIAARTLVGYPVYHSFRGAVDLLGLLMTGFLVASVARAFKFRPMSAALAILIAMAVEIAVDRPLMTWLYGPPFGMPFTLTSWFVRWVRGIAMFGGALLMGVVIGRVATAAHHTVQSRPSIQ